LRTSVRFFNVDKHVRALVVTSSVAGEGATTVASNLAVALAQSGDQVILVDANLRQPMVSELFGLDPAVGLTTVLTELPRLDDALQRWHRESALRVLTSGSIPPNPSELLGSHRMLDVISALKERAAVVVFDTPPLLPVTDAAALSRLTDGVLVVCRAHSTTADQLERASQSLKSVGTQVLGLVLNRVSYRRSASDGAYNSPTAQAAGGEAPGAPAERQVRRQHVSTSGRHA
jgi:capsular exopolysaccharide synthesis family protein